ncbi:hypothetical protein M422DRAFT_248429 [Sphaerobolus stellatus SS14]|uniref:Uncharacterized protein n=1 Tax=Sphaerobolus stellatus (strain SS14) TaxID=990650 RepID=A0A0C9VIR2_SPHS4|nr:hypothetical protein M422DRAFT_248429 [Sphaerobolus stellatus SS14]
MAATVNLGPNTVTDGHCNSQNLAATGFEILVTSAKVQALFYPTPIHASNDHRSWVAATRKCAPSGIDLVVNFDTDLSWGEICLAGSAVVSERYVSIDWATLAEDEYFLRGLEEVHPALSVAHEKALSNSPNNVVLLGLEDIDPELSIIRADVIPRNVCFQSSCNLCLNRWRWGTRYCSRKLYGGKRSQAYFSDVQILNQGKLCYRKFRRFMLTPHSLAGQAFEDVQFTREKRIVQYLCGPPGVSVTYGGLSACGEDQRIVRQSRLLRR